VVRVAKTLPGIGTEDGKKKLSINHTVRTVGQLCPSLRDPEHKSTGLRGFERFQPGPFVTERSKMKTNPRTGGLKVLSDVSR